MRRQRGSPPAALSFGERAAVAIRVLAVLLAAAALFAAAGARPGTALAHANVEGADPAPDSAQPVSPSRVAMRFTEPLAASLSAIQVLDAAGQPVDRGDSTVDPTDPQRMTVTLKPLQPGTYTVFWHNVSSVDGHALRGTYIFYIGEKPANAPASSIAKPPLFTSPLDPVVRWIVLTGVLIAFGAVAFQLAVAGPATGGGAQPERAAAAAAIERRTRRVAVTGLALFAAGSVAHVVVQAMSASQLSAFEALGAPLRSVLTGTQWGHLWIARMALVPVAAAAVLAWWRAPLGAPSASWRAPSRHAPLAALVALAAAMLTMSFQSHGAVTAGVEAPTIMSDYLHLLAAGAWAGGLVSMVLALDAVRRLPADNARRALLGALAARFSAIALLSTGTLIITGVYSAWAQVVAWRALNTPYGRTIVFKASLLALLIALGAANLRLLRPRLARDDRAGRWLGRVVRVEVALVALVVIGAAVLTSLEPARQTAARAAASEGITFADKVETTGIAIAIQPGSTGANRIVVDVTDARGRPVEDATRAALRVQFVGADLGAKDLTAQHASGGRYVAEGAQLSLVGRWQLEITVSRPDALDARTAFRFEIAPAGQASTARFTASNQTARLAWAWEVILLGGLLLAVTNTWWSRDRAARAVNIFGSAAVIVGVVMWFGIGHTHVGTPPPTTGLVNPFAPDRQSMAKGRELFAANCVTCHGATGLGDGPSAVALNPPPANLATHVPLHSDGELFQFIANGFPRTAMPAFRGKLSDEQIWNLVNFLRTLEAGAASAAPTAAGTPGAAPSTGVPTSTPAPATPTSTATPAAGR